MTDLETVLAWQRAEIDGYEARRRIGARSYGDLYRVLHDNGLEPTFRPGEIARQAVDGTISREEVAEVFGLDPGEVQAFISAWTAGGNRSAG